MEDTQPINHWETPIPGVKLYFGEILGIYNARSYVSEEKIAEINEEIAKTGEYTIFGEHLTILEMIPEIHLWEPTSEEYRIMYDEEVLHELNWHCKLILPPKDPVMIHSTQKYHLLLINYGKDTVSFHQDNTYMVSILDLNPYGDKTLNSLMEMANDHLAEDLLPTPYTLSKGGGIQAKTLEC